MVLSDTMIAKEWFNVLQYPDILKQFPSQFGMVIFPLWAPDTSALGYRVTKICAEVYTRDSANYLRTMDYMKNLSPDNTTTNFLQLVVITWRGISSTENPVQFQLIIATNFNRTYIYYVYGNMGPSFNIGPSQFPILKGYVIQNPYAEKDL